MRFCFGNSVGAKVKNACRQDRICTTVSKTRHKMI
jgi:hypothetical protein